MSRTDPATVALRYVEACARRDFDSLAPLLAHDVVFHSPWGRVSGSASTVRLLRQLAARFEGAFVRKVFTDGAESCVIHDVNASPMPAMEWVKVEQGRISRVTLLMNG